MLNSATKKTFALLTSGTASAKDNMRTDKMLFEGFKPSDLPVFRVYGWEASFTYGASQDLGGIAHLEHLNTYKHKHAQRLTGGGILFHGNDVSYALVIPTSCVKELSVKESYELICGFLMTFYRSLGLEPEYAKDVESIALCKSAFCQEGFEPYDILIEGKKIGGNAQRRSKEAILQHGSVSIDNSAYSLGNSLEDLGVKISFSEAQSLLIDSFSKHFNAVFEDIEQDIHHAS